MLKQVFLHLGRIHCDKGTVALEFIFALFLISLMKFFISYFFTISSNVIQ